MKKSIKHLRHVVYKEAKQKHLCLTRKIVERLEYELDVIEKDKKQSYFLSIMEIFILLKEKGIYASSYSVLNSLVAYYLGISSLNPIDYSLLFERILVHDYKSIRPFEINTCKEGLHLVDTWLKKHEGKLRKPKNLIASIKDSFIFDKHFEFLNSIVHLINIVRNEHFQIDQIPLSDYKTMKLFQRGDTEGILDFSSVGISKYLIKVKPGSIQDLAVVFAMYRPGMMEFFPDFIKYKTKQEKIMYLHPFMKKYIKETHGIIVYQEQLVLILTRLTGFNIQESNSIRIELVLNKVRNIKDEFKRGCKSNVLFTKACENKMQNVDLTINNIWNELNNYSKYVFFKSFAIHSAIIAFQIAFIKTHYKNEFEQVLNTISKYK